MPKPACFVCTEEYDPVKRQPLRISCGHCVCALCIAEIIALSGACPLRCRSGAPICYRDIRAVDTSVVETTEEDDIPAILDLDRALVNHRRMLRELIDRNATHIAEMASRVSSQQDTLSRFSLWIRSTVRDQKVVLYTLHNSENRLIAELEHEKYLLNELAVLQTKYVVVTATTTQAEGYPRTQFTFQ
ncbi:hypothetical protein EST38_g11514 [Candolleomyces aberdarensis]|uniref:RING-type domain-containing protein n=1 Tax=Candolleomyces aberdarensis TaxID=2316362 RepID=A0A4Q2D4N7_9AGAR|nr:hypothetical protein EST38_g11514 [Candolleomyces aberdarensis]